MPKKYPNDMPTTRDIYNAWLIFSGDRRGVYEPQVDREFYNWLNKTLRENTVNINTPKPGVDHDGPLDAGETEPADESQFALENHPTAIFETEVTENDDRSITFNTYWRRRQKWYDQKFRPTTHDGPLKAGSTDTAYFDIFPEMWAKLTKNVGYDPDNKWELEEADIETFDCTMAKLRKPWLHAQPGETWLIFAYNDYRGCDMWMIAETENNMFVVEPAIPNDSFNMYYRVDSPSIHTARKLED